ncbi:BTB-domain-containing protein [Rhizophagus irregularis]|uniref:BTB-domain-containing protein n=1 Tax=Rhizophagus irregularis TaxID=588596 RepID=A0A2I1GNW8_9GLOM|nr:BTB-domain-containing protein [Rhizophagus irregularis]
MPPSKLYPKLSKDLENLLESGYNHDVIIQIGEESTSNEIKEFKVHSLLLGTRSLYFRSALSNHWAIKKDGMITFKKPNISPKIFEIIIRYIYTGEIDLEQQENTEIIKILVASDELILEELIEHIQEYLINEQSSWLQENVLYVLRKLLGQETCKVLRNHCLEIICRDPQIIFDPRIFDLLDKNILLMLITRDDLAIDEIKIWQRLIQWGCTRISFPPPIPSSYSSSTTTMAIIYNLKNWTSTEFESLKDILADFIPLIRFFHISRDDFHQHIYPFRKILPKTLKQDLISYYVASTYKPISKILSPRVPAFDSIIISYKHAILIENWISKKDDDDILPSFRFTSLTSAPTFSFYPSSSQNQNQKLHYEWHLLYRASRDDFSAESFHAKCDNQGACVVAIKVKDQSIILGGYNPIGWFSSSGSPSSTDSSFIYYLDLNMFPLNFKLSRVLPNKTYQAIYQSSKYGPIFGAAELCIYSNCDKVKGSKCLTHNIYEQNILFGEFCVEDYEVFKVNVD